jgi:hypothetical protein
MCPPKPELDPPLFPETCQDWLSEMKTRGLELCATAGISSAHATEI